MRGQCNDPLTRTSLGSDRACVRCALGLGHSNNELAELALIALRRRVAINKIYPRCLTETLYNAHTSARTWAARITERIYDVPRNVRSASRMAAET